MITYLFTLHILLGNRIAISADDEEEAEKLLKQLIISSMFLMRVLRN